MPTSKTPSPKTLSGLRQFVSNLVGLPLDRGERITGGGSHRVYVRFKSGDRSVIGVIGTDSAEIETYLAFTQHFLEKNLPVPRLLGAARRHGFYAVEDGGPDTLAHCLKQWQRQPDGASRSMQDLTLTVHTLAALQVWGGQGLDYALCHDSPEYTAQNFMNDLNLFLECFLPRFSKSGQPASDIMAEFRQLARWAAALRPAHFCHRDFQTRNILWRAEGPMFLDFQGGRRGPVVYDLASLLYSPDSRLDHQGRLRLTQAYQQALWEQGEEISLGVLRESLAPMVLIRRLQALGAYARIHHENGDNGFLEKIPAALKNLKEFSMQGELDLGLPLLEAWLKEVLEETTARNAG